LSVSCAELGPPVANFVDSMSKFAISLDMTMRTQFERSQGRKTMPEYAIMLYGSIDAPDDEPDPKAREEHTRHAEELETEGQTIAAFALESYKSATSIRSSGITDGPFLETKEVVLGLYVVEARDLDAALAIATRNPIINQGGGVEVRPVEGYMLREPPG
jgi:hypothetical protein